MSLKIKQLKCKAGILILSLAQKSGFNYKNYKKNNLHILVFNA
jgi:hypothetical protein